MTISQNCEILLIPPEINSIYLEGRTFMPLGILALTASLRKENFRVEIFHPNRKLFNQEDYVQVANQILNFNPVYVGFSTWCNTFSSSLLVAEKLKQANPAITIIFGGPQASILSTELLKEFDFIDYVLIGEADETLPLLLNKLKEKEPHFSEIPGLTYKNNQGKISQNKELSILSDLDMLPIPAYDLVPGAKTLKLDVGRGCPFQCTYCTTNNFFSKKYRTKSAERIISEMNTAFLQSEISSFSFAHDLFTFNHKFIKDFCAKLQHFSTLHNRKFEWSCSSRIDCINNVLLTEMKDSGCTAIFFGIESGSSTIQKSIKKNLNLQKVMSVANSCRKLNIEMYTSFIIGFPDETEEDIEKTIELILQLAITGAHIQISELALLPGTPLFETHKNELQFDGIFSNFSNATVSKAELELIVKYPSIFSSFYYLPIKALSRKSIIVLTRLINLLGKFRNTIYRIGSELKKDIEQYEILYILLQNEEELFKNIQEESQKSVIISKLIQVYLRNKFAAKLPAQIVEVFHWEARQNLLKDNYLQWKLLKSLLKNEKEPEESLLRDLFRSTPTWDFHTSTVDLEELIPEKNKWTKKLLLPEDESNYYYLLSVVSDNSCKLLKISGEEYELLHVLKENSYEEFIKLAGAKFESKEMENWLRYLENNGVLTAQSQVI